MEILAQMHKNDKKILKRITRNRARARFYAISTILSVQCLLLFCIVSAWDCSAWVRTYALYLEERLECFRVLKYDVEAERLTRPAEGHEKV